MSEDWEENARRTQEETEKLRRIRAGFLDVAIDIEIDLRSMLVGYFVPEENRRRVFADAYESQQGTIGRLIERFNKVLTAERDALASAGVEVEAVKAALSELLKNRNTFAHQPMDQYFELDPETLRVTGVEMRIGRRFSNEAGTYFTVETAEQAYERARECDQLIVEMRGPFSKLPRE